MELAASRRIRAHFTATHHFNAACSTAYNELLSQRASAGVGPDTLHAAVVRVHEVLRGSLRHYGRRASFTPSRGRVYRVFRTRRGHRRLAPALDGVDRALLSLVPFRISDLTEEIVVNEAEFEKIALDVIVEEVLWYLKWDLVSRILTIAVVVGVVAVGNQDQYGYLAVLFAVYSVSMVGLYFLGVRFRAMFFLL